MKRPWKLKILAVAALPAIALAASIAWAQSAKTDGDKGQGARSAWRGRGGHGPRWGAMPGGFLRQLNLTDDQKAKLKQMRESFAASDKPLREQLRAKRQELRQTSEGGTFNETLATQKLTEMAGLEAKLMGERFKLHQEMLSVLTAEQKAQLEQMKSQFKARHGQRQGQQ